MHNLALSFILYTVFLSISLSLSLSPFLGLRDLDSLLYSVITQKTRKEQVVINKKLYHKIKLKVNLVIQISEFV